MVLLVESFERGGGLERVTGEIARGLSRKHYAPEIWCVARGGGLVDEYRRMNIPVRVLEIVTYHNPVNILKLVWLFHRHKPDIVHTQVYYAATIGRIAAWLAGVPVVIHHVHSTYRQYTKRNMWIDRVLSRITDRVICVSEAVRQFVVKDEGIELKRTAVIPNGISREDVCIPRQAFRSRMQVSEDVTVITTVASLLENKGHADVLEAVALLVSRYPQLRYWIVGQGPEELELKKVVARLGLLPYVRFWGLRSDVADILTASDIFVLASRDREGQGVAILQAMAYGVPVVATDVGGIPEVVQHGQNGRLVKPRDPRGLADALLGLMHDRETRVRLSHAGRETFEELFDARHMIQRLERVYEECVKRG